MPRGSRLLLCCLALLLSISLYYKGRANTGKGEGAAFFPARTGEITVRLSGEHPRPGLYRFPVGVSVGAAIKMTLPDLQLAEGSRPLGDERLLTGQVVTLWKNGESVRLSLQMMGVKERMLLKIPLDPDLLDAAEWACLPGIGPVLSERIVSDRHKNGAFGSLDRVERVPGIGRGKLAAIRRYF